MIAEALSTERTLQPDPAETHRAFLGELRRHLGRHDLDDETLGEAVRETAGYLAGSGEEREALLERLYRGRADAAQRRALVAALCLPAPRAPLAMPTQVLERRRAALMPRLAALRDLARRRIGEG
jgi:hypothetical protein